MNIMYVVSLVLETDSSPVNCPFVLGVQNCFFRPRLEGLRPEFRNLTPEAQLQYAAKQVMASCMWSVVVSV